MENGDASKFTVNTNTICVCHSGPNADSHLFFAFFTAVTSSTKVSGSIAMDLLIHLMLFAYARLELEERVLSQAPCSSSARRAQSVATRKSEM